MSTAGASPPGQLDRHSTLVNFDVAVRRVRESGYYDIPWNAGKVLYEDHAAYSDLCVAPDMSICCLFDHGRGTGYDGLALARFDLAWLTDGEDALAQHG